MQLPFLFTLALALPALASQLDTRAYYAGGGFALMSTKCPAGLVGDVCGTCCPPGFEIENLCGFAPAGTACCPKGSSCAEALNTTPFCADSTWTLWNTTTGGLFCCLPHQIGTNSQQCVSDLTVVAVTLSASNLGQPIPSGAAGSTIAGGASSSTSATGKTKTTATSAASGTITATGSAATATVVSTTTKGGIVSVATSLLNQATSKSQAMALIPLVGDWKFSVGGLVAGVVGAVGFAVRAM